MSSKTEKGFLVKQGVSNITSLLSAIVARSNYSESLSVLPQTVEKKVTSIKRYFLTLLVCNLDNS